MQFATLVLSSLVAIAAAAPVAQPQDIDLGALLGGLGGAGGAGGADAGADPLGGLGALLGGGGLGDIGALLGGIGGPNDPGIGAIIQGFSTLFGGQNVEDSDVATPPGKETIYVSKPEDQIPPGQTAASAGEAAPHGHGDAMSGMNM